MTMHAETHAHVLPALEEEIVLERSRGWTSLKLGELWGYRELFYFLAWRDVKVRYKQTALGTGWAVLQPVLTMIVFTIFFGRVAKIPSEGIPYPLFSLAGLLPWTLFSNGLTQTSNSLVASANLLTKVYFPRLIIPTATTLATVLDFALSLLALLVLMLAYGFVPPLAALLAPAAVALSVAAALGVGLWLSALNVQYRDVRYVVPVLIQLWLLATPIAYPSSLVQEPWRTLFGLNPMAGAVEAFRWMMLDTPAPAPLMIVLSCSSAAVVLVTGAFYFKRMERRFADVV